ncbi:aldolase/citrate lyase/malate synthase family protein [Vibrio panuliri]|uniref:Malate synthase n=1 Tax=Vibrio panuliri TaxID=1381081 RepID=A0A1Q9HNA8_9VIBR|nr:malate synthase [Vibrio panuliri]KAB1457779.1 hypothetical protein F7O85_08570 [Vibrio panuliri]OLQ85738.1 malate synthase [Vibrio panuliri]OLQ92291.1 malate synthase [Vibrio panuliri]
MNMQTFENNDIQTNSTSFIANAVFAVEAIKADQAQEKQMKTKQLLDKLFPLENGSHCDVTEYVIDLRHVMAFFKDGTHSGLKHPKHFVAFTGEKEHPHSILFRDGTGSHMEVTFGRQRGTGSVEFITIDDIQMETCTTFPHMEASSAMRHWISLVKGDKKGKPMACSEDKEYTAKNGDDYRLDCCYKL